MFLSSEALAETMARFGDVIRLAIFAHTHMDEVRLLAGGGSSASREGRRGEDGAFDFAG